MGRKDQEKELAIIQGFRFSDADSFREPRLEQYSLQETRCFRVSVWGLEYRGTVVGLRQRLRI